MSLLIASSTDQLHYYCGGPPLCRRAPLVTIPLIVVLYGFVFILIVKFSCLLGTSFSCGACKFLRRKCTSECAFTPYFSYCLGADHFAAVHKVFGASNVSKLLMKLPLKNRSEAAFSISYEALARMHDPIYGCVAQIISLEEQVASLQKEIDQLGSYLAYASFGQSNYVSLQEINDPNTALPFYFQFSDTGILDHLHQQTPPLLPALQASCFLNGSEGQIAQSCSFLDQPVTGNDCTVLNTQYQRL